MMRQENSPREFERRGGRYRYLATGLVLAGAFFAAWYFFSALPRIQFGALASYLPYLLLLLCPLMHVFMHRGHGSNKHDGEKNDGRIHDRRTDSRTRPMQHGQGARHGD